jgi:Flp pilus assembly pilin Flp
MKTLAMLRQVLTCRRFAVCQQAQDLIEYTLLLAFVTLGAIALISGLAHPVSNVWSTAGSHLEKGKEYAKGHDK